jgi:hypothetical protein
MIEIEITIRLLLFTGRDTICPEVPYCTWRSISDFCGSELTKKKEERRKKRLITVRIIKFNDIDDIAFDVLKC